MADEKKNYPTVNKKHWFALRKQFAKSMPAQVTLSYLSGVLSIDEQSARANVLGGLRIVGLVDTDDRPTPLASRWRDNDQYPDVCEEIRQAVYPDELKAIAPDIETPLDRVRKWFMNKLGEGESGAAKHAAFYRLLQEADPSKEAEAARVKVVSSSKNPSVRAKQAPSIKKNTPTASQDDIAPTIAPVTVVAAHPDNKRLHPSLHIDIQIHISPESSADQIEQIFASMAKHLKDI